MAQHSGKFIAYYRVSTGKQGKSGLGIEAQRAAVASYLNGGDWLIVAEFTEVESGKRSDRPALEQALAAARLHRASLVVSKVDRLTRSVAFLSKLLEAGVVEFFLEGGEVSEGTFDRVAKSAVHEVLEWRVILPQHQAIGRAGIG